MDYVVGSVAALISGNVTPSRPRLLKRALTPTKHQPSPNVTPKSEFVEDRSIFLSPTVQKKKAIVKKSPKRIFENPDVESTESNDGNSSLTSPKADKVKKHLKNELDSDVTLNKSTVSQKSPKSKLNASKESISSQEDSQNISVQNSNENTPKKKKKKRDSVPNITDTVTEREGTVNAPVELGSSKKSPKKMLQRRKSIADAENTNEEENQATTTDNKSPHKKDMNTENKETVVSTGNTKKKNKKRKKKGKPQNKNITEDITPEIKAQSPAEGTDDIDKENVQTNKSIKKKNKKQNNPKKQLNKPVAMVTDNQNDEEIQSEDSKSEEINPNAITNEDSDSEHDSDNEIESENEEINKKVLHTAPAEDSSDEEEENVEKPEKTVKEPTEKYTAEEIKRTVFVGNVPFSSKCKKEIKKIFGKHGQIETIRIRTVPIKDGRFTPKLALIKNELHPERTTVNVYVKFADASSVDQALSENNVVLNEHHLRVSRSDSTGAEHDPRCSVFVGNLPFALEDESLRDKFQDCGEIQSVRIIRDKKTNAGKGFGYVNFSSKDGVELALALTEEDLTIKNRILRVKRCTQATNKQKSNNTQKGRPGQGNQGNQSERIQKPGFQRTQGNQGGFQKRDQSNQGKFQRQDGNQGRFQRQDGNNQGRFQRQDGNNQGRFQRQDGNNQGRFQRQDGNNQGRFQRQDGNNQGRFQRRDGNQGRFQRQDGNQGRFQRQDGNQGGFQRQNQNEEGDGAFRRIMKKRKSQEGGDGPPDKKQKSADQPSKDKKVRKEFVGMTAEKKKKRKFDKGQKKKKVLSEILTK